MGADVESLPLPTEDIPQHRLVDADIALDILAGREQGTGQDEGARGFAALMRYSTGGGDIR